VLGALFLFGMILAQHPYSFIGVAVLLLLVGVWSFFSSSSREVADFAASVPSTTTAVIKKGEVESKERAEEKVEGSSREQTPPSFPSSPRRVGVSVSHETGLVDLRRGAVLLGELEVSNASQSQSQDEGGVHVHGDRRGGVQLEPPTLGEESDRGRDRESEGDSEGDSSGSGSGCGSSDSVWDINGGDLLSDSSPGWSSDSSSLSSTAS
jgi:hypothetical protein